MMNAILVSKDGKLLAMNKPEKPNPNDTWAATKQMKYEHLLQSSISAAEEEQVLFKDQEAVKRYIVSQLNLESFQNKVVPDNWTIKDKLPKGKFFTLPSGWEIRVEHQVRSILNEDQWNTISEESWNDAHKDSREYWLRKVATLERIAPKEEPKEEKIFTEEDMKFAFEAGRETNPEVFPFRNFYEWVKEWRTTL